MNLGLVAESPKRLAKALHTIVEAVLEVHLGSIWPELLP